MTRNQRRLLPHLLALGVFFGAVAVAATEPSSPAEPGPGCCASTAVSAEVTIRVDGTQARQTIEGFGATTMSLVYEGPLGDTLTPELRRQAIEAAYGQIKLNGGNLNVNFVRPAHDAAHGAAPAGLYRGYRTFGSEAMKTKLVDLAAPLGFTEWCLSPKIEIRWSNPQLRQLRQADYPAFLAACGEQVAVCARFWRERYQLVPRFIMPFNEPTSGNGELAGGNAKEVAEIVRAIGQRLRAEGFADVQLVVPCEETVARSLAVAEVVLGDEQARPFVGAIGYHCCFTEQDTVVLVDNDQRTVHITGMGYAIGHYARWVRRGAVRIDAESSDPLVQVTAFRDDAGQRLALVVINNGHESKRLLASAKGCSLAGKVTGEQSTAHAFWNALPAADLGPNGVVSLDVPALSVTSLALPTTANP